jgi:hypothetical protein
MEEFDPSVLQRVSDIEQLCDALDGVFGKGERLLSRGDLARSIAEGDRWRADLEASLDWQPITDYARPTTGEGRLAMFRLDGQSDFGAWIDGAWTHVGGFGQWPFDFEPTEWAILPPKVEQDFVET